MKKPLAIANLIVFGGMIYMNFLGGTGAINDISTGEVSGLYPTLFTPAGVTFSIWSVIYLFNLAFVVHQLIKAFRFPENFDNKLNQGFFFICITNAAWIVAWHRLAVGYALFLMFILLVFLIATYWQSRKPKYTSEFLTEYVNFSIYLGWISVATIANSAIYITAMGVRYDGTLAAILTLAVLAVAVLLGLFFLFKQHNPWYTLVILWASVGIYLARSADLSDGAGSVKIGAIGAVIILVSALAYHRISSKKSIITA
jgi:hypothetical protein